MVSGEAATKHDMKRTRRKRKSFHITRSKGISDFYNIPVSGEVPHDVILALPQRHAKGHREA